MLILEGFNEDIQIIAHVDPIQHLSVDSDADADLVKIHGLKWMKYLGIRHLSGHYACSLGGPHHGCGPNRVDGIYDVTIARHQTLCSHPHTCLSYINQAKHIFIARYWNVIIIRYWIGTEPQNCIN